MHDRQYANVSRKGSRFLTTAILAQQCGPVVAMGHRSSAGILAMLFKDEVRVARQERRRASTFVPTGGRFPSKAAVGARACSRWAQVQAPRDLPRSQTIVEDVSQQWAQVKTSWPLVVVLQKEQISQGMSCKRLSFLQPFGQLAFCLHIFGDLALYTGRSGYAALWSG